MGSSFDPLTPASSPAFAAKSVLAPSPRPGIPPAFSRRKEDSMNLSGNSSSQASPSNAPPGSIREGLGSSPGPVQHKRVKGRRGCVVGQGELKRGGRDPLFALNHTAAMLRANVNRLFRRTWCTTKRMDRLKAHLMIYIDFHNTVLTAPR